ncbi:disintegrin and metalloproteinase domain-containing protein 12 [Protopterus annectens]|uniref:disintegrin and metalloproteinase domain-containing protein 12 n=1 Tax=Protopterus annectens TaxID=7888 RepID=UPI001CFA5E6B|nr:disintegrin and metalloproteinase domain-containing protein 12 [Protopterus annectens]
MSSRLKPFSFKFLHLLLTLSYTSNAMPSPREEGVILHSNLEIHRQSNFKNQLDSYETTVPFVLNGEKYIPLNDLHLKIHPAVLNILMEVEGEQLVISLERNEGLFASSYTETHYSDGGSATTSTKNYTGHCYYHGNVQGYPNSAVTLSTCSGLRGFISFKNKMYFLEPSEGAKSIVHLIYRTEKLQAVPGSCGHSFNISGFTLNGAIGSFHDVKTRYKRAAIKTTKYVELVIVADNREFQRQGKDVEKVKQRLIEIANYVDKFYRSLNIRVALVGVEVWNDADKCSITQDPFLSLHEFLDWRKLELLPRKPHDNAQLVSGVYFQGTTIGMAPIMSMCTAEQSGGVVMDHSENALGAAVTMAHELGHNLGMNHDTPERSCDCRMSPDKGGCIMTPSTGVPFPTVFSSCSRRDLDISLEKGMGMCLFNVPEVTVLIGERKCGNGYVEEGEECDCGEPEECMNPCCNASTCTLKLNAVCAHGLCCEDCMLKPAGILCRDVSNACDLPEFCTGTNPHCPANVYLHDGHPCHDVDGYCYNGMCQTHEQQCITLWGQGAKPAPDICFEKVNSAGDPYGNCGKDSKDSFAKCEPRDAKCGKIQCQGGASRPVIGTNAVSIETNIPLQGGGKILCRGTHVYLGDDLPDPGLVLAGTKCEEDKICLNRQCQNVSVFGIYDCTAKCNERGVCNNKKHCHCDADWAPPYCDIAGLGGSVDSGPVRLAENNSLTVAVLVPAICLITAVLIICFKRKTVIKLLFTNKKTTMEKIRSVSPKRPSSPNQTNLIQHKTSISVISSNPQNVNSFMNYETKCLPRHEPDHISKPIQTSPRRNESHQSITSQWVLPSLSQLQPQKGVPSKPLPRCPSNKQAHETFKPSPPQKPLPANPLSRSSRSHDASEISPEHPVQEYRIQPVRPAPKYPPQLSRCNSTTYRK